MTVQNNGGTTGGITRKGFMPGRSGNPGGSDRLEASKLLADRGWGKAAAFEPLGAVPVRPRRCRAGGGGDAIELHPVLSFTCLKP
jgi:hypothetical protein